MKNIMPKERRIMISGMGIQCAIADNIESFAQSLRDGCIGINAIPDGTMVDSTVRIAAILENFVLQEQLAKLTEIPSSLKLQAEQAAKRAPLPIQTSIICALQAWQNARLYESSPPTDRVGLVVSCDNASQRYQYDMMQKFALTPEYLSPRYALHALETDHVGVISELLNVHGEGFVVGGASASGNVALLKASQMLTLGLVDACIVIGALSDLSPLALQGFYNMGAMGGKLFKDSPKEACRPFDASHEGFIYGQGCACIILEAEDSINKRGISPLAEFLGGVLLLDGQALASPCEAGEAKSMTRCLDMAGLQSEDVDYINAHGSSSPLGDRTEINAIKRVFSKNLANVWINSTKGLTGHCLFSAGVVEAIACIVQMQHQFIHPNMNLHHTIDSSCLFAPAQSITAELNIAMSNSFGFGGINSSILLKRP